MKFKLQTIVLGISLLLIFSVLSSTSQIYQSGIYSDSFDSGTINPVWTIYNDPGVGVEQSNGVLTAFEYSLGSSNIGASIYKNISSSVNRVDVDYSFNFLNGMGRLYLIGRDSTGTKITFIIGMNDGWSSYNAKPIVYIYDNTGLQPNASSSWHLQDSGLYTTKASGGTGHITVYFNTSTMITVVFTFPETYENMNNIRQTFQLGGITQQTDLSFTFPPSIYYENGECYKLDNYAENGLLPATSMSRTCPVTSTTTDNTTQLSSTTNLTANSLISNTNTSLQTITTSTPGFEFLIMISILTIFVIRRKIKNS